MKKNVPLGSFLKLTRVGLSFAVAFSALTGFILRSHRLNLSSLMVFVGVFLLSGSAAAINQVQEKGTDLLMERTRIRPIPSKVINPREALILSGFLGFSGLCCLFFGTNFITTILGIFNLSWYTLIYTPLKRKTGFAILPGSLTGAIPVVMGWTAAGGQPLSPFILCFALFMIFWQITHFLLLSLQYQKQYLRAGFPPIFLIKNRYSLKTAFFCSLFATCVSCLYFSFLYHDRNMTLEIILIILNVSLFFYNFLRFPKGKPANFRSANLSLYTYQAAMFIMFILL